MTNRSEAACSENHAVFARQMCGLIVGFTKPQAIGLWMGARVAQAEMTL